MEPQAKRNLVLGIVGVALLGWAGYRMFSDTGLDFKYPDTFTATGVCLSCQQELPFTYGRDEDAPYMCDGCGEHAVYPWWFCQECRYKFIPRLISDGDGPPRPDPYPVCTHCGCNNISGWDPNNPYLVPEGTAELPKWP